MPLFDEKHVILKGGVIIWEALMTPETIEQGKNAGKPRWKLKCVFPPNSPDIALYQQLADKTLLESEFKGVLPQGGYMPIGQTKPGEFNDAFPGWSIINFKTSLKMPDVYDENGQLMQPMAYGPLIFSGQHVDVLADCYGYNQVSKGVGAGVNAISIIVSANAQRQVFGTGGLDTSNAFGPGAGQPAQQATSFLPDRPGGPGGPAVEPKYFEASGNGPFTREQLLGVGYKAEQIDALRPE